jgi:hypothetical protein
MVIAGRPDTSRDKDVSILDGKPERLELLDSITRPDQQQVRL